MTLSEISAMFGIEEEDCIDLVTLLLTTSKSDLEQIKNAVKNDDMEQIEAGAHSIKGASGNLGFNELAQVTTKAEQNAKDGVKSGWDEIIQEITDELNLIEKLVT